MSITKISPSVVDFDDGITITVDDNSDALTLTSTDADASIGPVLNLYRNSSSPADVDLVGSVKYVARNDNSQDVTTFTIQNYITDVSDGTEDAASFFYLMEGGSLRERIGLGSSATVINEDGLDVDFRVESDGNANALIVNAGNNNVGIGADPLISYSGYTTLYVGGNTNFMSNTAAEASSSVNYSHNAQFDTDGSWEYIVTDEASNYYQSGGGHYFRVAASGSAGSDITWVNGPNIDVNGNLVFPSGKGIDFSATSNGSGTSSVSELLDDYEEGTWTPAISSGTATFSEARYTKIGRLVRFSYQVQGMDDITSNNHILVTGLPFPVQAGESAGVAFGTYTDNASANVAYATTSESVYLYAMSSGTWDTMLHSELNSNGNYQYVAGTYQAES